ncbi:MAG: glutathione S-transferase [Pseudomonadota bacterium]
MSHAVLTISSRNYSSWSLRGWLLCKLAGLELSEEMVPIDSPGQRAELLLLSPSVLVPRLTHEGASVWDTLAIAEYLAETFPDAGLYPEDKLARAHCRSISGEIHSGFHNLRSALPMNLKARHDSFRLFAGAKPDIERVHAIWRDCLERHGGPWLFGAKPTVADAMFAPVATRFVTYAIPLDAACRGYVKTITDWPLMQQWTKAALAEPEEVEELDAEF